MDVSKQKRTMEEEDALKAGVIKHGSGKWHRISEHPEFCRILHLRSNIDLKDKWQNHGSSPSLIRHDDDLMALSTDVGDLDDGVDVVDIQQPLAVVRDSVCIDEPKVSLSRSDNLIFEAITCLKEPTGSNKTTIAMYIEDHGGSPLNLKENLSSKLLTLTESGKLIKVRRKYRISPNLAIAKERSPKLFAQAIADAEAAMLEAEAAARAVEAAKADAEAAMLAAEEATREAEAAEADAEAARAFAEAAMSTMSRNAAKLEFARVERDGDKRRKYQTDADLTQLMSMPVHEAATAAAQAIADAEASLLEAEEAVREAEVVKLMLK